MFLLFVSFIMTVCAFSVFFVRFVSFFGFRLCFWRALCLRSCMVALYGYKGLEGLGGALLP